MNRATAAHCTAPADDMPPVTDAHLRTAFAKLRWPNLTYDQVMADPVRSKVVQACAHQLRRQEWERTHARTVEPVKRVRLGADGHPIGWCTQAAPGAHVRITTPDLFTNQPQPQ